MANNRSLIILSVLLSILSLVGSFAINVASSNLPETWTPYLWLAYPITGAIVILTILFIVWQGVVSVPSLPTPSKPAYIHEGWFLKHFYLAQDDFTGRKSELNFLNDWLQNKNDKPLLALVALGGFGKSALIWHWINNEAVPKNLSKVVWWGFYDDSSFETFLSETLEYLDINSKVLSISDQVEMLARYIHQNKILIVMDGFERALRAYSSMNAAYQGDDQDTNEITNNQCVSIHAAKFLQRVATVNAQGRVLLTTRLLPDDVKIKGSTNLLAGCLLYSLDKLSKEDAIEFFKKQKIQGTRAEIEAACEVYGYHPLSLRLLSGQITKDRSRDIRLAENFKIDSDLKGRQNHILKVAYENLSKNHRLLLSKISAFRSPMTLEEIKVFEENLNWWKKLLFGEYNLQSMLNELVSRGLLHHDSTKDKYDLHPIVRRFAYNQLTIKDRTSAHERLINYFETVPEPEKIEKLEDLVPVIELYHHIVKAGNLDKARKLYYERIRHVVFFQFGAYQLSIELLLSLFPDGENNLPLLQRKDRQASTLNDLASAYSLIGQPHRAAQLFEKKNELREKMDDKKNFANGLVSIAAQRLVIGTLKDADRNLRHSIDISRKIEDEFLEAVGRQEFGRVLSYCGTWQEAEQELIDAEKFFDKYGANRTNFVSVVHSNHALYFLLTHANVQSPDINLKSAIESAQHALELANETAKTWQPFPRDHVRAYWLLGSAYRINNELTLAEENLSKALNLCRQINLVDHEADILLEIAKLRYAQENYEEAKSLVDEALTITERCGYVLQGADVNLFLSQYALEQENNRVKAKEYAQTALKLAYCDGPPYYYKVAYHEAEAMLEKLK